MPTKCGVHFPITRINAVIEVLQKLSTFYENHKPAPVTFTPEPPRPHNHDFRLNV